MLETREKTLRTVNSLSGGKTSSYLAVHYPADLELFALVCVDCHNAAGPLKRDKGLLQRVQDKLEHYNGVYDSFIGTTEDPAVIKLMFDLEQLLGREIIWVRGDSWESMMDRKRAIPNQFKRFCTYELKIKPIFEYLYMHTALPVEMRCGFRYDEKERGDRFSETIDVSLRGDCLRRIHRWDPVHWRVGKFPLIDDRISHPHVQAYWAGKTLRFPEDSNCQHCFWKNPRQLRKNFDAHTHILQWASVQEILRGHTFQKQLTLEQVKQLGIQADFEFGGGSGCQAGFCTD